MIKRPFSFLKFSIHSCLNSKLSVQARHILIQLQDPYLEANDLTGEILN